MSEVKNDYQEFNKFQTLFYTSVSGFNNYTNYEIKKHSFILLNNIAKGFPHLADMFGNINTTLIKFGQSPALIKALQRRFITGFTASRVPQFIYYKNLKAKSDGSSKTKVKETVKGKIFDDEIVFEIKSILRIDSKTFDYIKFSPKVQKLGEQLLGEILQEEKTKKKRKTNKV